MMIHKLRNTAQSFIAGTLGTVLVLIALVMCLMCARCAKDPCLAQWECGDCNCLFDKYQAAAQTDLERMNAIKECYDRACK
jgi:hypothetical protein